MKFKDINNGMPERGVNVLLLVKKRNKLHITEGYLIDTAERAASERLDVNFWRECGYGDTFFDYSKRQICNLCAKNSKNEVIGWLELSEKTIEHKI